MQQIYLRSIQGAILSGLLIFSSCQSSSQTPTSIQCSKIEMSSVWDNVPDRKVEAIFAPYKARVDSIMAPVIGRSAVNMTAKRPESLLSNLIADVLRESTIPYTGRPADLSIINIGGLRSSLSAGEITYGNVYEILPFENILCIVSLRGKEVRTLLEDIAEVAGEGVSNVQMIVSPDRKLTDVKIGGSPIDDNRVYEVATVDFLAEGNDKMHTFKKAEKKTCIEQVTLRNIFVDYVKSLAARGMEVTSSLDGRITIK